MSEQTELSISELRRRKRGGSAIDALTDDSNTHQTDDPGIAADETWVETEPRHQSRSRPEPARYAQPQRVPEPSPDDDDAVNLPFDPYRAFDALKRNWFWCVLAAMFFGALGLSYFFIGGKSFIQIQLARQQPPSLFRGSEEGGEAFKPQTYTDQALINLVQAPEVVRRVAAKLNPPVEATTLARSLLIFPEREAEVVTISFNGKASPQRAAQIVNLYAEEVIQMTKGLQAREADAFASGIEKQLSELNKELSGLNEQMSTLPPEARTVDADRQTEAYLTQLADLETKYQLLQIDIKANNPIADKLRIAREELAEMLIKYTDEHPFVLRQQDKIKSLEKQVAAYEQNPDTGKTLEELRSDNIHIVSSTEQKQSLSRQAEQLKTLINNVRGKLDGLSKRDADYVILQKRYQARSRIRDALAAKQMEVEAFRQNPPGVYTLLAPATPDRVFTKGHLKKTLVFAIFGAMFGAFAAAGLVVGREVLDDRVKTVADLERATGLPVLATLGDLAKMSAAEQKKWAFRTWTILKGKLSSSQSQGLVCGLISAEHGEGRSTWIKLLVNTANQRGLRVLTVSTQPTAEPGVHPHDPAEEGVNGETKPNGENHSLTPNVLSFPAQIARQLNDPNNSLPVVHIPLPGWVWNLERRKQWQNALAHWRKIENLVLLVELPPASEPESVLLAEKLPQVLWIADSGKITLKETRQHLETLRHGGCNVVGAVLNREPNSFWKHHLSRWFTMAGVVAFLTAGALTGDLAAEESPVRDSQNDQAPKRSFSVNRNTRAAWQQKLTLGPGDVLNLGFFGETNLLKTDVAIGPDGRISYLQATDVMAAGLTVDELRTAFDKELSKYYRAPRTIVTPVTFKSKKYFLLGKVMNKGVFTLDRPITVLEALARANGIETGLLNRNSVDLADLQRSFLVRNGKRIPIDFEKLFNEGDLSQNIPIEPNDFVYIPPANLSEVYVVGEVNSPGIVPYNSKLTLIAALSERGGFNAKAFKSRVLVIRGSLNKPEAFAVNTHDIVDGKMRDFELKPKDIIYVSYRPFIRVEELLDLAATAFIQSAVTAWTGGNVGPFITAPVF